MKWDGNVDCAVYLAGKELLTRFFAKWDEVGYPTSSYRGRTGRSGLNYELPRGDRRVLLDPDCIAIAWVGVVVAVPVNRWRRIFCLGVGPAFRGNGTVEERVDAGANMLGGWHVVECKIVVRISG